MKQPEGDFRIEVKLTYHNGPDHNPYRANVQTRMHITRRYLTPEQIRERDDKKVGALPPVASVCALLNRLPRSAVQIAMTNKY